MILGCEDRGRVDAMGPRQEQRLTQTQTLRLNATLATSIRVLRFDATGLVRYLEEQADRNPGLRLVPHRPDPAVWTPRWRSAFAAGGRGDQDVSQWLVDRPAGLVSHAMAQADRLVPRGAPRRIAHHLIEALEPSGWLGRSPEALASDAGIPVGDLTRVLDLLRTGAEPTGLFATSLADCLRLQAREANLLDPVLDCLLDHLDLLAQGDVERLSRMCRATPERIRHGLTQIRGFDPKPGAQFGQGAAPPLREPDLTATKRAEGWEVSVNRSALPELSIDDRAAGASAAREVERMVESRNATLLRVGRQVFARQIEALDHGLEALVPMTMADIGADLGLHPGTVSRCVAGVSVDTPRGTWWLRALFSTARGGDLHGATPGPAAAAVRARLGRLIASEHPSRPLGDQALAEALAAEGMPLARRTVAKYREMLAIPAAHRRRVT